MQLIATSLNGPLRGIWSPISTLKLIWSNAIFSLKKETGLFTEFWEVLAGPPELFAEVDSGSSDDDEDDDDWSDDNDDNDNPIVGDIEPVCAIM